MPMRIAMQDKELFAQLLGLTEPLNAVNPVLSMITEKRDGGGTLTPYNSKPSYTARYQPKQV